MSSLFDLTGKRALVTGSSQGIGAAIAAGLAEHGASIVLNGRDPTRLQEAAEALRAKGFDVARALFDVTDAADVAREVARIEADVGPIDVLINNAGVQFRSPLEHFPVDQWNRLLAKRSKEGQSISCLAGSAQKWMLLSSII